MLALVFARYFWSHVDASGGPDACWLWTLARTQGGRPFESRYGWSALFKVSTHRLAWSLANGGRNPGKLYVLHSCDNPPCCNPAHLRLGAQLDNRREAARKGHCAKKLTLADAVEIHVRRRLGESWTSVARRFGVARSSVGCVLSGRSFRHARAIANMIALADLNDAVAAARSAATAYAA